MSPGSTIGAAVGGGVTGVGGRVETGGMGGMGRREARSGRIGDAAGGAVRRGCAEIATTGGGTSGATVTGGSTDGGATDDAWAVLGPGRWIVCVATTPIATTAARPT